MPLSYQLQEFFTLNPWCSYLTVVTLFGALLLVAKATIHHEFIKAIVLLLAIGLVAGVFHFFTVHEIALWVDENGKKDGDNAIIYWVLLCALESGLLALYHSLPESSVPSGRID